jgi:hypothetical protein
MNDTIKINLDELLNATQIVFNHLKKKGIKDVSLSKDYYWEIDSDELYNVATKPGDLTIGSLVTDWEFVDNLAKQEHIPVVSHLLKIAALLRCIGDTVGET